MRRLCFVIVIVIEFLFAASSKGSDGDAELASWMSQMQVYLHKLDLSVQAENEKLISFYLHELEELSEEIVAEVDSYDGFPVGELTESLLIPQIEAMEKANEMGDTRMSLASLIDTCNVCHEATDHGYIRITKAGSNPFNQDFSE
jgi:hypothetical protein